MASTITRDRPKRAAAVNAATAIANISVSNRRHRTAKPTKTAAHTSEAMSQGDTAQANKDPRSIEADTVPKRRIGRLKMILEQVIIEEATSQKNRSRRSHKNTGDHDAKSKRGHASMNANATNNRVAGARVSKRIANKKKSVSTSAAGLSQYPQPTSRPHAGLHTRSRSIDEVNVVSHSSQPKKPVVKPGRKVPFLPPLKEKSMKATNRKTSSGRVSKPKPKVKQATELYDRPGYTQLEIPDKYVKQVELFLQDLINADENMSGAQENATPNTDDPAIVKDNAVGKDNITPVNDNIALAEDDLTPAEANATTAKNINFPTEEIAATDDHVTTAQSNVTFANKARSRGDNDQAMSDENANISHGEQRLKHEQSVNVEDSKIQQPGDNAFNDSLFQENEYQSTSFVSNPDDVEMDDSECPFAYDGGDYQHVDDSENDSEEQMMIGVQQSTREYEEEETEQTEDLHEIYQEWVNRGIQPSNYQEGQRSLLDEPQDLNPTPTHPSAPPDGGYVPPTTQGGAGSIVFPGGFVYDLDD